MNKKSKKENKDQESQFEKETEDYSKIKDKINDLEKLKNEGKIEEFYKQVLAIVAQNLDCEKRFYEINSKNENLNKEINALNITLENINTKTATLDKNNKFYMQKMNDLQEEKKKIIKDEMAKRNEIIKKTEDYMKEYQQNFENDVPEKEALLRENMILKQKIEAYVQNTKAIKENVENQMKLKDQQNLMFEDELKNQIKSKMDELSKQNDKAMIENKELKEKNQIYAKKFEEINKNIVSSNETFSKMKEDIEKRNAKIIILEKENMEIKNKEKQTESSINEIEKVKKQRDLNKTKIIALNKIKESTIEKIAKMTEEKNKNQENTSGN